MRFTRDAGVNRISSVAAGESKRPEEVSRSHSYAYEVSWQTNAETLMRTQTLFLARRELAKRACAFHCEPDNEL